MKALGNEHLNRVRKSLAEQGTEYTPEELRKKTQKAFAEARGLLRSLGFMVPDDDEGTFLLISNLSMLGIWQAIEAAVEMVREDKS